MNKHQPKIDTDLIKDIWRTIGVQSSDERVYKIVSAMMEAQMLKIIGEFKMVSAQQQQQLGMGSNKEANTKPSHISFEDLSKTMEEFDVVLRRPAFLEEKQLTTTTGTGGGSHTNQRPNYSYSSVHTDP